MNPPTTTTTAAPRPGSSFRVVLGAALVVLVWAYWPSLAEMAHAWAHNNQYSHGYLVPIFAAFLLWYRRDRIDLERFRPSWWAVVFLLMAVGLRGYGAFHHRIWLEQISLIPCVFAVVFAVGGRRAFVWAWPAVLFLFFMIPLPFTVAGSMSGPLQRLATICSTFLLQTLGMPAVAEGNIIRINDASIGIVEACSGLKMLVVFFALSTGMVMVTRAPLFDRILMVLSSVPIALASNIIRITVTGLLHELVDSKAADVFFHDVAGWLMMPLALGMLWLEQKTLARLLIESNRGPIQPRPSQRSRAAAPTTTTKATGKVRASASPRAIRRPVEESAVDQPAPTEPQSVPA